MIRKFKSWLVECFLPAWAKDTVYQENADLRAKIKMMEANIGELEAYIDGLERGIRSQRRIVIHNEVAK